MSDPRTCGLGEDRAEYYYSKGIHDLNEPQSRSQRLKKAGIKVTPEVFKAMGEISRKRIEEKLSRRQAAVSSPR